MILENNIIFLDTNTFEGANFIEGQKLNDLLKIAIDNDVQLKVVDITYGECLKRIEKRLRDAKTAFKKAKTMFYKEGKMLRVLPDYKDFFSIPKIDVDNEFLELKKAFDEFLHTYKFEIIDSKIAKQKDVFHWYFEGKPPFSLERKKHQFPDAFILSAINSWCEQNKLGAYIITSDNDLLSFESKRLDMVDGIDKMREIFVKANELYRSNFEIIENNIEIVATSLKEYLKVNFEQVSNQLYDEVSSDPFYEEIEQIEPSEIIEQTVDSLLIIFLDENSVGIGATLSVDVKLPIEYIDLSNAVYDREDGRYWNVTNVLETSIYRVNLYMDVYLSYRIIEKNNLQVEIDYVSDIHIIDYEKIESHIDEKSEFSDW